MPITFNDFLLKAQGTIFSSRDIIVDNALNAQSVKHGNLIFSSGQKTNDATMAAFKQALQNEYGVFGLHAFDTIVGTRAQLHKSLRASDIKAVDSQMEALKQKRFANEVERQLETSPAILKLGDAVQRAVKESVRAQVKARTIDLKPYATHEALSKLANDTIMAAIQTAKANPDLAKVKDGHIRHLGHGEEQIASDVPMGLSRLAAGTTYRKRSTSVEDHVKTGTIGVGMRVNFKSSSRPAIFEKLKTNGVEPGFIYHNDWSKNDTRALMIDIHSDKTKAEIDDFIEKGGNDLKEKARGKTYLEKGLLIGRAHRAGVTFAAEYVLSKELDKLMQDQNASSPLIDAIKQHFGPEVRKSDFFTDDGGIVPANLKKLKTTCFVPLRDAVMTYSKTAAETDPNAKLPVFKHFTDRHILKLDYNEGDRVKTDGPTSSGKFRLPERVSIKGGAIQGHFYRKYRLTTADKASVGAVSEALANDLTRILGVPAQELTLVRGQYSDGHPKIMLEAKFADGYHDLEDGFINDGRIQGNVESLGKYKAIFLALADRDAIGSHGQNKGVIDGKFFAIDPGHSLEGNGKDLEIHDNLSFVDTKKGTFEKRFRNYSVFDDDTRFNKMQGVLKLRQLRVDEAFTRLFLDYGEAFNPDMTDKAEERTIREQVKLNISKMWREFDDQVSTILDVCKDQLDLYDALERNPATKDLQEGAINTIENLEKLTSPTTWKSEHGKVELTHLSVIEETRIPWTAKKEGDTLVYTSQKPLSQDIRQRLQAQAEKAPQGTMTVTIDQESGKATINVPIDNAKAFFDTFSEGNIAQSKHPTEFQQRVNAQHLPPAPPARQQPLAIPLPPPVAVSQRLAEQQV